MRWIDTHGHRIDCTFACLDHESNRFANALNGFGISKGDIFFALQQNLWITQGSGKLPSA